VKNDAIALAASISAFPFPHMTMANSHVVEDCTLRRTGGGDMGRSVLDFLFGILPGLAMTI
jgi:hypothetical protein